MDLEGEGKERIETTNNDKPDRLVSQLHAMHDTVGLSCHL